MRILIDTHILIWHLEDNEKLSLDHSASITDPSNIVFISIASFWEIAIKISRSKLSISRSIEELIGAVERSNISILPIKPQHTIQVSELTFHHKDPFDRMIIAQALVEDMPLISTDSDFTKYGVTLL